MLCSITIEDATHWGDYFTFGHEGCSLRAMCAHLCETIFFLFICFFYWFVKENDYWENFIYLQKGLGQ